MEKTRVGIIGSGGISNAHMHGYNQLTDLCEVVACCDTYPGRAEEYAKTYNIPHFYTSYQEMLEKENLDAVSVTTWNAVHAEATIAALNAGCHVICEKPMAMNTQQAIEMEKAAIKNNKVLQIGFVRRYGGDCLSAKDFIDSGKAGKVFFGKVAYERQHGCPGGWFADVKYSGGGPLIDLGVHVMDLARYLVGKPLPVSVYAVTVKGAVEYEDEDAANRAPEAWSVQNKSGFENTVEDFATGLIRFDNGFVLNVSTSFNLNILNPQNSVELFGTKAGISLGDPTSTYIKSDGTTDTISAEGYPKTDFDSIFDAEMAHFIDCVRNGTECRAPAHDGVVLMQIIDALYESARTGKEVKIAPLD